MFLVCLVLNEVFLIVCCNTPNPTNKAINSRITIYKCFPILFNSRHKEIFLSSNHLTTRLKAISIYAFIICFLSIKITRDNSTILH